MAMAAAEDCTIMVKTIPISTHKMTVPIEPSFILSKKLRTATFPEMSGMEDCRYLSPKNKKPAPKSISPKSFCLVFLEKKSGRPKPISTIAMLVMSIEKPKVAIIQPVTVVPMLAPKITPIA